MAVFDNAGNSIDERASGQGPLSVSVSSIITPTVATPTISPSSGSYSGSIPVTLGCSTPGATIYYTIDGNDPTTSSNVYSGTITLTNSAIVKAKAVENGYIDSAISSNNYTITSGGGGGGGGGSSPTPTPTPTPTPAPFTTWQASHFSADQLADSTLSGWNGDANGSGIPNGLKFLFDLNPAAPMSASDSSALPQAGIELSGAIQYLTLTYRQNPQAISLGVNVQVSPDLTPNSWQTIAPDITENLTPDAVTGDPRVRLKVNVTGQQRKFIRLQVVGP